MRDLDYGHPQGRWELRDAIATRLRRLRGIDASPERIVIVNGTQQALDLISSVLLHPGDRVLIEEPHYTGARCVFMSAGAKLLTSAVDNNGIQVPKVRRRAIRFAYVTPSHQFPTGVVLPIARRLELLDWASRVGAFIVDAIKAVDTDKINQILTDDWVSLGPSGKKIGRASCRE